MVNQVILVGRVGRTPELAYTATGRPKLKFSLATSKKYQDKMGKWVEQTQWHTCELWGPKGEAAMAWLNKGTQAYVEGEINYSKYKDKTGQEKYFTNINVNKVLTFVDKPEKPVDNFEDTSPDALIKPERPDVQPTLGDAMEEDIPF